MKKNKQIVPQNSFTEFLLYTTPNGKVKVEIFLHNENVWLTQAKIAELFDVDRSVITKHLKNIFESRELQENSVCANFAHTAADGKKKSSRKQQGQVYTHDKPCFKGNTKISTGAFGI